MSRQRSVFTFRQVLVVTFCFRGLWLAACRAAPHPPQGACAGGRSGWAVARVAGFAEEAGECRDGFEQQRVDAGLLVGGVAGAELGDGATVLGLSGELAQAGGDGGAGVGHRVAWPGHGQSRVSSATAFLAQASSTRSLPLAAAAMSAAVAALLSARGSPLATRCSRAMASSANSGSSRPASAR